MSEHVVSWPDESYLPRELQNRPFTRPFWLGLTPAEREQAQAWDARAAQSEVVDFDPLA